ncbi:hypothetical protein AO498_08417 [Algoriphagus sanaruensis]|jgi:hypothetical protein|uniref:Uncharacterized protein n=1 Tax=Algoriphagus sanaruensis TaxID=1727163 RepID=A0A142EMT2_9BACT|nr:hypothetical protein AO498_08417 [Algoriphagus sanaruensis]
MGSNTTVIILVVVVIGHFLLGLGYLLYKLSGKPKDQKKED